MDATTMSSGRQGSPNRGLPLDGSIRIEVRRSICGRGNYRIRPLPHGRQAFDPGGRDEQSPAKCSIRRAQKLPADVGVVMPLALLGSYIRLAEAVLPQLNFTQAAEIGRAMAEHAPRVLSRRELERRFRENVALAKQLGSLIGAAATEEAAA